MRRRFRPSRYGRVSIVAQSAPVKMRNAKIPIDPLYPCHRRRTLPPFQAGQGDQESFQPDCAAEVDGGLFGVAAAGDFLDDAFAEGGVGGQWRLDGG